MSTKSTIFLTKDNEHCFTDCNDPIEKNGKLIGNALFLELDKRNVEMIWIDEDSIELKFTNPESEIYKLIHSLEK